MERTNSAKPEFSVFYTIVHVPGRVIFGEENHFFVTDVHFGRLTVKPCDPEGNEIPEFPSLDVPIKDFTAPIHRVVR